MPKQTVEEFLAEKAKTERPKEWDLQVDIRMCNEFIFLASLIGRTIVDVRPSAQSMQSVEILFDSNESMSFKVNLPGLSVFNKQIAQKWLDIQERKENRIGPWAFIKERENE